MLLNEWLYSEHLEILKGDKYSREVKQYLHSEAAKADEIEKTKKVKIEPGTEASKFPLIIKMAAILQFRLIDKISFPAYNTILASKGDVTTINNWKHIDSCINVLLIHDKTFIFKGKGHSKYFSTLETIRNILIARKVEFKKSFMKNNSNPTRLLYVSLVLSLLNIMTMLSYYVNYHIMTSSTSVTPMSVEKYFAKRPKIKRIFDETEKIINDKDLAKFTKIDFSKTELMAEADIPMELFGESNMVSLATVIKFGLASLAYKICCFGRFMIYYCYYMGYQIEKTIDDCKRILTYYSTESGSQKLQLSTAISTSETNYTVAANEAVVKTDEEIKIDHNVNASNLEKDASLDF
ncbi:MAG: hypothetical protein ACRCZ9_12250 [Fusobacteriaceae bacterium]